MDFYIVLLSGVIIAAFFEFFYIGSKTKNLLFIAILIICIFFSAIRWTNPDWDVYYPFFVNNNDLDDFLYGPIPIDKGFGVVNFAVKMISDDFSALLLLLAIVIIPIKGWFIKKFSYLPLLSILLWFCTYIGDIFVNRQSLAIAITMIGFYFIIKRRPFAFCLTTIIAASMQVSVIAFLLAYPLYYINFNKIYLILGMILSIAIGHYLDNSLLISVASMVNLIDVDTERLLIKINTYTQEIGGSGTIFTYSRRLIFIPIEIYMISKMKDFCPHYRGSVNLILFGYMIYFLLINVSNTFATRISSPFYIYEIVVIPNLIAYYKNVYIRLMLFVFLVIYSVTKYVYAIQMYPDSYIPYVNILWS